MWTLITRFIYSDVFVILNFFIAIWTIVEYYKNPNKKWVSYLGLLLASIGTFTTKYTLGSIIGILILLTILLFIYMFRSYAEVEHHCTQAKVLFDESPDVKDLINTITHKREPKIIRPKHYAKGLELVARMGESYDIASDLLKAAGLLSIAVTHEYLECIKILVEMKRFFKYEGDFESLADRLAVSSKNGLQLSEVEEAFLEYKDAAVLNILPVEDFLSSIIISRRSAICPKKAGRDLAAINNQLGNF